MKQDQKSWCRISDPRDDQRLAAVRAAVTTVGGLLLLENSDQRSKGRFHVRFLEGLGNLPSVIPLGPDFLEGVASAGPWVSACLPWGIESDMTLPEDEAKSQMHSSCQTRPA